MQHRQEARREIALGVVRQAARIGQHDERRQVVGQAAQAVGDPRAHARKAGQHEARVHHVAGRAVDVGLRRHRHQEREVIDALGDVRKDAADPAAALRRAA